MAKLRLIVCNIAICVSLCVMNMRCINLTSHLVQGQGSRSDLHCITDNYVKAYALHELQTADSLAHISRGSKVPTLTETIKCTGKTPLLHYWRCWFIYLSQQALVQCRQEWERRRRRRRIEKDKLTCELQVQQKVLRQLFLSS